jgi:hypothetical protein
MHVLKTRLLEKQAKYYEKDLHKQVGKFEFVPLISEKFGYVAQLNILLLTSEEIGQTISQGGNLDNRLKTLLDALRIPTTDELPKNTEPEEDEVPFFCLLEEDSLISGISIESDWLLQPANDKDQALLLIQVNSEPTYSPIGVIPYHTFLGV